MDMYKCLEKGAGKTVTKKQTQDFVKSLLYENSLDDLLEIVRDKYAGMPAVTAAILHAVNKANKSEDFSKLKPILDFAFEKDTGLSKARMRK